MKWILAGVTLISTIRSAYCFWEGTTSGGMIFGVGSLILLAVTIRAFKKEGKNESQ